MTIHLHRLMHPESGNWFYLWRREQVHYILVGFDLLCYLSVEAFYALLLVLCLVLVLDD